MDWGFCFISLVEGQALSIIIRGIELFRVQGNVLYGLGQWLDGQVGMIMLGA